MSDIRFYRVADEYGDFSNFASFPVFLDGTSWPTAEHYFQACKFKDSLVKNRIRSFSSPMQAAKEGRSKKNSLRPDWEGVKDEIMLKVVFAKFVQHPNLRKMLLLTGDSYIVEHTKNDAYWGDGGDGRGKNVLGKILVKVRDLLSKINDNPEVVLPPWIAFPGIDQYDLFWRMGLGENYLYKWSRYYLGTEDKSNYHRCFPEPQDWDGFFE